MMLNSEVIPIQNHGNYLQVFRYKRIKMELITKVYLETIYRLLNTKEDTKILESPEYYYIQYGGKPIILLGKHTGRLYCLSDFSREESENQASYVIRILHRHDLVEEQHSNRIPKYKKEGNTNAKES